MAKVALVFGATGIVGSQIIEELANTTKEEWKKIIFTSRREPILSVKDDRFQFVSIDLELEELDAIKDKLLKAGADETTHVYFTAYVHDKKWDGHTLCKRNIPIFTKPITVIDSIAPNLQRIVLQLGAKYYGVHLGPLPGPFPISEKTTPRHRLVPENPDFYFAQEDFLVELQKGKKWTYTTTRPNVITGVSRGNGMSFSPTIALYFLIQKELGKKAIFFGPQSAYKDYWDTSNATLIAQFSILASTHPRAANEAYNIMDHVPPDHPHQTVEEIWVAIGDYFGVDVEGPSESQFYLESYMSDKEAVWKAHVKKHGGSEELWQYATFDFVDVMLHMPYANGPYDSTKAREEVGWNKGMTASQSSVQAFDQMRALGMIPSSK